MIHRLLYESPVGRIVIGGDNLGIREVRFENDTSPAPISAETPASLLQCREQLEEYFCGFRKAFDLPLTPEGTPFYLTVWQLLQTIPYGHLSTYRDLALQLGNANFTRAVGMANARNPIAILIPCHRIIGANGSLTGYAGGLSRKQWLLNHEQNTRQGDLYQD